MGWLEKWCLLLGLLQWLHMQQWIHQQKKCVFGAVHAYMLQGGQLMSAVKLSTVE
jgi:hypothetical protein